MFARAARGTYGENVCGFFDAICTTGWRMTVLSFSGANRAYQIDVTGTHA
jgi:hypothetical protein